LPDLIDTQAALEAALSRLRDEPAWAVDTESNSFYAYKPKICLLQISVPGLDLLLDPLAGLDLDEFGALLGDPEREVVLHAAENDIIAMKHEQGWRVPGLFDTQVASFVLGFKPYSLAGILEARFDLKLDKSEQRSDWGRRPLTPKQLRYAADDTHYLLELAKDLKRRAAEAGRDGEIAWECRRIAEREWEPEPFDPEGFRKISGARDLDPINLRILRDLYLMRKAEAERRDVAAFRVFGDHVMVKIATERAVREGKGMPKGFARRYGRRVEGILESAPGRGPLPKPKRKASRGTPMPPEFKQSYERLRRWRSKAAEERGVEPWVVARNELLSRVAAARTNNLDELAPLMAPFRLREYGEAMLAVLTENFENGPDR